MSDPIRLRSDCKRAVTSVDEWVRVGAIKGVARSAGLPACELDWTSLREARRAGSPTAQASPPALANTSEGDRCYGKVLCLRRPRFPEKTRTIPLKNRRFVLNNAGR